MSNNLTMPTRDAKREECRIFATVRYFGQTAEGRVVNLSDTGMALQLREAFNVTLGSRVTIVSGELGHIDGKVRWLRNGQVGIEYSLNTNALAQVSSYFRFFHQQLKPVVTR